MFTLSLHVCMCARDCVCCVCVCERVRATVCVCVCVCVRERERERVYLSRDRKLFRKIVKDEKHECLSQIKNLSIYL